MAISSHPDSQHAVTPLPFTPEIIAAWMPWWQHELRHLRTPDLQAEIEYTARELNEAFDDPIVKAGYLENPGSRVAGLVLRQNMLAGELQRRQRWEQPGVDRVGRKNFVDFAHDLKDLLQLHEYLVHREGLSLHRMGSCYEGLCPFHTEKTPSFIVHPLRFHCFGCGSDGDVYDYLLMAGRARNLREAVNLIADYLNAPMPK